MEAPFNNDSPSTSVGAMLAAARQKLGMTESEAANRLLLDTPSLAALESDQFASFGASVFVRGHLRRYAELVALPVEEVERAYEASKSRLAAKPDLSTMNSVSPSLSRTTKPLDPRLAIGGAVAVVVIGAVYWALHRPHAAPHPATDTVAPGTVAPLQGADSATTVPAAPAAQGAAAAAENTPAVAAPAAPGAPGAAAPAAGNLTAAATPATTVAATAPDVPAPAGDGLHFKVHFPAESWTEIYDARGKKVFFGQVAADSTREWVGKAPLRVLLGRPQKVDVAVDGRAITLPYCPLHRVGEKSNRMSGRMVQPIRGMNDVLPADMQLWRRVEDATRTLFESYGYEEIRVPIVESTDLFKRSIGEFTDIVEKEMYTFKDLGGDSLTLRPEATAGVVRAVISNGLLRGARHKFWCSGPMFRHERPQKGRYRQFYQVDVEAVGFPGPDIDAELIAMTARLWRNLGITRVQVLINSLGTPASRAVYREKLVEYFRQHESALDEDSRRRLQGNPLRILDSKNPDMRALIDAAPLLTDYLDEESAAHFAQLRTLLDGMGIAYRVEPRLVRGLDYYSRTVFEWVTDALGSQDAICSGGRYDTLIEQLGGDATPAIGFDMGIERCVELVRQLAAPAPAAAPLAYVIVGGQGAAQQALALVERLREDLAARHPQIRVVVNLGGGNLKTQFRRADRSGADLAIILGDDELQKGVAGLKPLRVEGGQIECPLPELAARVVAALVTP